MKPLNDYSHISGFNYTTSYAAGCDLDFWEDYRHDIVDREMGYAERLGLNSARVFFAYTNYLRNKKMHRDEEQNVFDKILSCQAYGFVI